VISRKVKVAFNVDYAITFQLNVRKKQNSNVISNVYYFRIRRKNIDSLINAAWAHTIHVLLKRLNAAGDYLRSINERMN
jgi:hypothetical protein